MILCVLLGANMSHVSANCRMVVRFFVLGGVPPDALHGIISLWARAYGHSSSSLPYR